MDDNALKRPFGLTLLAILWFFAGLLNAFWSFQDISVYYQILPYLSSPLYIHEWFKFAIPVGLGLSVAILGLSLLQLVIVPGLLLGKPYSYKPTLIVSILFVIVNVLMTMLYTSAPAGLNGGSDLVFPALSVGIGMFWVIVYLIYLPNPT